MPFKIKGYGWKPDHPDHRDFKYAAPADVIASLPGKVDLRGIMPPRFDQLNLGSCTAHAIAAMLMGADKKVGTDDVITPSRLFIYYNERLLEGMTQVDSGAYLRDGLKSINRWGYPDEKLWPYNVNKFALKPKRDVYAAATTQKVINYHSVQQDSNHIKSCLAEGYPLVFGFTVYESFESDIVAKTGKMPMPLHGESPVGGHAVCMVGYDDRHKWWIVQNSWGEKWGENGFFFMPYNYALDPNLADDFWTVRDVV